MSKTYRSKRASAPKMLKHLESRIALAHEAGDEGSTVIDAHVSYLQILAGKLIAENSLGGLLGDIANHITSGEEILTTLGALAELNFMIDFSRIATVLGNNFVHNFLLFMVNEKIAEGGILRGGGSEAQRSWGGGEVGGLCSA